MTETCRVCGIPHNPWMTCRTAYRLATRRVFSQDPPPDPPPPPSEPLFTSEPGFTDPPR
jgi:hypothetical protein